jgi:metallo-beta-lactamase family protein
MIFEMLLKCIFDEYGLKMNFEQYVLVGSTVRSYLSWLKDNGNINAKFVDNQLVWNALK